MSRLDAEVLLYDGSSQPPRRQRDACLAELMTVVAERRTQMLVLERDESVTHVDRKIIHDRAKALGCAASLTYRHLRAVEEPLLAIPDAVAWCWQRGEPWRSRLRELGLLTTVTKL